MDTVHVRELIASVLTGMKAIGYKISDNKQFAFISRFFISACIPQSYLVERKSSSVPVSSRTSVGPGFEPLKAALDA